MSKNSKALVELGFDLPLFKELTSREQMFVMHPMVLSDPVQAAKDVGYADTTAVSRAHQMRHQLLYFIKPLAAKRAEQQEVSFERLVYELKCVAYAKLSDYLDTVDTLGDTIKVYKDVTRLPDHLQRAVKSVEFESIIMPDGTQFQKVSKIELHDRLAALKQLRELTGADGTRPPDRDFEQELSEHLEPSELEAVNKMYLNAAKRAKATADKLRDRQALPGVVDGSAKKKDPGQKGEKA